MESAVTTVKSIEASDKVERFPFTKCLEAISRIHAATHLPGIFDDQLEPTEELIRRRISALKICESRIFGSGSDLSSLTSFVNELKQIRRGQYHVSNQQSRAMIEMCKLEGDPVPEEFTLVPAISSAVLLHWRVLLVVVACLNDKDRQDLVETYPVSATLIEEEGLPKGFDSHFHLDRTRRALNRLNAIVEEICQTIRPDRDFRFRLTGGVAVFCDPGTHPSKVEVQDFKTQGFAVAIGMHP